MSFQDDGHQNNINHKKIILQLRLAALNEAYSGNLGGQRGVDYACYKQAKQAGLEGTFRAFLATKIQNLDSLVREADRDLPVVNLKVTFLLYMTLFLLYSSSNVF